MQKFNKVVFLTILILFAFETVFSREYRQEIHSKHFFYGYPYGPPLTNDLIIRDLYALSSNDSTKFADWVAYRLDSLTVTGKSLKKRYWKKDPWLDSAETLEPEDYKNAGKIGFDRGHQAPLADFKGSIEADDANYLSNITPQKADLNRGAWKKLEAMERELVGVYKEVWVITGPYYQGHFADLPGAKERLTIPSGYWKIVCVLDRNKPGIRAFVFSQNTSKNDRVENHLTTVDEVEKLTGLDFFWEMDNGAEKKIESEKFKEWFYQIGNNLNDDDDDE